MITDLLIYESGDGGNLSLKNNEIQTIEGLTNQIYLALFGGNLEGDWWGNSVIQTEKQFQSTFEKTISENILSSGTISILVNAANEDLKFLKEYADLDISGAIYEYNKFTLFVTITEPDKQSTKLKFVWDSGRNELIENIVI